MSNADATPIPRKYTLLFQLAFLAFFTLPLAFLMVFYSLAEGEVARACCLTLWILAWAAFYRHGMENWRFKEVRDRFDGAFNAEASDYSGHADEDELRNLMARIEEASEKGYFETVADIRRVIPKIANRGNISKKFREEIKTRFPYLDIH